MDCCRPADATLDGLPSELLVHCFACIAEDGHKLAPTRLVSKRWAQAVDDLALFWQHTACREHFAIVQYGSQWREHVRVKHVPTSTALTVHDVGVLYDGDAKPYLSLADGHIHLVWMQSVEAAKKHCPTSGTWMMCRIRLCHGGLCWAGDATDLCAQLA